MAGSFVQNHTSGTSGSGTAVTVTLAANVPAGNLLVVWIGFDNTGTSTPTVSSLDKPGGETATWAQIASHDSSNATSAAGVRGEMWVIRTTQQWNSATVVTATLSASPPKSCAVCAEFTAVTATLRGTAGTNTSATGAPSAATSGTALVAGDLVVGGATFETSTTPTDDTDTTNGSWSTGLVGSATGGATASQVRSVLQWKIVNAAGVQTYNPTANSTDSGAAVAALQYDAVVPGAAALTGTATLTAAGALTLPGAAAVTGTGTVTAAGDVTTSGTTHEGQAAVTVTATRTPVGHVNGPWSEVAQATTLSGGATVEGTVDFVTTATIGAVGNYTTSSAANQLTGTATTTAAGLRIAETAATLTGTGTVTAAGNYVTGTTASLTGTGTVTSAAAVTAETGAAVTGTATITSAATVTVAANTAVTTTATITAGGELIANAAAALTTTAVIAADGAIPGGVPTLFVVRSDLVLA